MWAGGPSRADGCSRGCGADDRPGGRADKRSGSGRADDRPGSGGANERSSSGSHG